MPTLDPDLAGFIDELNARAVDLGDEPDPERMREEFDRLIDFAHPAPPMPFEGEVVDDVIAGVPVRRHRPDHERDEGAVVVLFHGGGWVLGDLDSAAPTARAIAEQAEMTTVSVHYRRAPEHPFPAALDDCLAVVRHLAQQPGTTWLAVAGDSAGGNLAAAVALECRDDVDAQLLLYPGLDPAMDTESHAAFAEGYLLTLEAMTYYWNSYAGDADRTDPRLAPARAADLRGVAPAVVTTAGFDPLRDEGRAYAARLVAADVPTTYLPAPTLIHGWADQTDRVPARDGPAPMTTALEVPYDRTGLGVGIVHLGPGAFHRSHQAWYLDELMRRGQARDWAVCDVGLLPDDADRQARMRSQDCVYTVTIRHPDGAWTQRVIGSIVASLHAPDDPEAVLQRLAAPTTRLVTLTITEGGYSVDPSTGSFVPDEQVQADLARPDAPPASALGFLAQALRRRHDAGVTPFTVLSCDNVQGNGVLLRRVLVEFTRRTDPALADWIERDVCFPSSMVDRITPVTSPEDLVRLPALTGVVDRCPVVAEPFMQWVGEDRFTLGRPPLEQVGVQLVPDVAPYEQMKLRMLNASHQVLAHAGLLAGHTYVHEAVHDPVLREHVAVYLTQEGLPSVPDVPGVDLEKYATTLLDRYGNAALADSLERIVSFATDRLQTFVLPVLRDRLAAGVTPHRAIATVAAWVVGCAEARSTGRVLLDNRSDTILATADVADPLALIRAAGIFGDLLDDPTFTDGVLAAVDLLVREGVDEALGRWNAMAVG